MRIELEQKLPRVLATEVLEYLYPFISFGHSSVHPPNQLTGDLPEAVWQRRAIAKFGKHMFVVGSKGSFPTWRDYYNYLFWLFRARAKFHSVEVSFDEETLVETIE